MRDESLMADAHARAATPVADLLNVARERTPIPVQFPGARLRFPTDVRFTLVNNRPPNWREDSITL